MLMHDNEKGSYVHSRSQFDFRLLLLKKLLLLEVVIVACSVNVLCSDVTKLFVVEVE